MRILYGLSYLTVEQHAVVVPKAFGLSMSTISATLPKHQVNFPQTEVDLQIAHIDVMAQITSGVKSAEDVAANLKRVYQAATA